MSKIKLFNGVVCPAITFFDKNYNVNEELNSLLFQHAYLNGARNILLFGTTGEGLYFRNKIEDKIDLINLAYQVTKEQIPIITGVFGDDFNDILDEIEPLGKRFKDLLFLIPPPMENKEEEELKSYYNNIFESFSLKNKLIIYNNPNLFYNNNISPNLLKALRKHPNLIGIKDSSDKFGNYKGYIENIGENFTVCCGKERNFSQFLQLIPKESRKYAALIPSIGNLVNICLKLFKASIEDNPLEIEKYQSDLNEFREKIFDKQNRIGKQQRGLKYAFYFLYRHSIKTPLQTAITVSPDYDISLEKITKDRIEATIRYLLNLNYIDRLYPIGKNLFNFNDLKVVFSNLEMLKKLGELKRIKGPYDRIGRTNTIFRMKFEQDVVLRCNEGSIEKSENICGEKILFPFLDGTLNRNLPELREEIKKIASNPIGSYVFSPQNPPIIPVGDLIFYDETHETLPCTYSIQSYIQGKPLYFYLISLNEEKVRLDSPKMETLFKSLGKILGSLHQVRFNSFFTSITDIAKNSAKKKWDEIFETEIEAEIQAAKNNKLDIISEIDAYLKDNISLIEEEEEAIAIHNDFSEKNIIIKEDSTSIQLKGIINLDNWRIGVRAQDFVPIYHSIRSMVNFEDLYNAFNRGYEKLFEKKINSDFFKKINIYSIIWLLHEFNRNPKNINILIELNEILSF
ncbi:MAG: dihydrodipicolinate synthase family protein [Promethearchaeota archaeon]